MVLRILALQIGKSSVKARLLECESFDLQRWHFQTRCNGKKPSPDGKLTIPFQQALSSSIKRTSGPRMSR